MYTQVYVENKINEIIMKYDHLFTKVILFGSYSRNEQNRKSDIDLFIESPIPTNQLLTSKEYDAFHDELYKSFDYDVPFDLLVFGGKRDRELVRNSLLFQQVLNDGIVIYDKRAKTI